MKKIFVTLILFVAVLAAVTLFRAFTHFEDNQPEPLSGMGEIDIDRDAAVRRFSKALTYPTISHDDRENFDARAFLDFHEFLRESYPLVHAHAERTRIADYSLVYHFAGSDPSLKPVLFMSHMDVVPIEEISRDQWTHPPFAGVVENGIVWGRGSVDDKIGVVALMEAMELLLRENVRPQRSIWLAFGHDEEVGGMEGAAAIAAHFKEQGIRFEFVLDEGGAVTSGMVQGLNRPLASIGISEKGYVNQVLTVNDPGGHSSQPPAQTAVGVLSRAIVRVEDNPFPARLDQLLPTMEAIGAYLSFGTRLAMANLWLLGPLVKSNLVSDPGSAAGIRTTTAATMASGSPKSNILPTRATGVINFRILPGETTETVHDRVVELIDDERVEVTQEYGRDPSPVSPIDTWGYRLVAGAIRGIDEDILVAPYMVRGGTDAKYFYDVSPNVYRFLMIRVNAETIQYIHGIDERVSVEEFLLAVRYYKHLVRHAMASSQGG